VDLHVHSLQTLDGNKRSFHDTNLFSTKNIEHDRKPGIMHKRTDRRYGMLFGYGAMDHSQINEVPICLVINRTPFAARATITLLMGKLSEMGAVMASHNNNITEFNAEVIETHRKLQSQGKSGSNDLGSPASQSLSRTILLTIQ
jgi:hypothetical protein